jgi:glycerol-3-phosphate dehydrogenase (NAD(P)+)
MSRAAVLGSGSWGTAFAMVLADAGATVRMWARRPQLAEAITCTHENPDYLPGTTLPQTISATTDPAQALEQAEFVVLAVPCQALRANLAAWVPLLPADCTLVSLTKGIEPGTGKRMSQIIQELAGVPAERVAVVSGPNLAREVADRQPAATVVACSKEAVARRVQAACHTRYFRAYTSTDVIGCELGGALKNVIALGAGLLEGQGLGGNARACLITRGLAEITRLGIALGADPLTFSGMAGLGDLVATCTSPLSRNRGFGVKVGRGLPVEEVIAVSRQTVEGVRCCLAVQALAARHGVKMPITETIVAILRALVPPAVLERAALEAGGDLPGGRWAGERAGDGLDVLSPCRDRLAELVYHPGPDEDVGRQVLCA